MIAIIGAMDVEVNRIQSFIENPEIAVISGRTFVSGKLCGADAVVVQCGIGKVNAALCTEALILRYHPDMVINTGVGGSLSDQVSIGDIALAERVLQHDSDTTALGDPIGFVSTVGKIYFECNPGLVDRIGNVIREVGIPMTRGAIASGDQFVTAPIKSRILANFDCIACDMEAGAIGHVCDVNGVDFAIIRSISDNADGSADMDYPHFCEMAAENAAKVVLRLCETLAKN